MERNTFLATLFGAALLSTHEDDLVSIEGERGGDFEITITYGGSLAYHFDGVAISVCVIRMTEPSRVAWALDDRRGRIEGPITHGQRPGEIVETAATERFLSAGVDYFVSIVSADGRTAWKAFRL
jgi:hypothetical protein